MSQRDKEILERWKNESGLRIEEIRDKIVKGELKVDLKGHNSLSVPKDKVMSLFLEELDQYIENSHETIKKLPDNIICLGKIHRPIEPGEYLSDTGLYCWDCAKRSMYLVYIDDTVTLIPSHVYWKLADESGGKYDFKLTSLDQIPACEITKFNIVDRITTEIDVPSGELVVANFFNDEQIYEDKEFDEINSLAVRIGLAQALAKKNVGYGQMGNMSINVYKKKDGTEILFADPYAEDHYSDNHRYVTKELQKKDLTEEKRKELEEYMSEELIEPIHIDMNEYVDMGHISLSVWRWQCADREILKQYKEEINDLKAVQKSKDKTVNYDKDVSGYFDYIIAKVKPGRWVIEHYYDLIEGHKTHKNIYSRLFLKE